MNTISKTAMKNIVFWVRRALGIVLCLPASTALAAGPEFFEQKVMPFVRAHCQECHSGNNPRASFSIEGLKPDFSQPRFASRWAEVMDAINLGTMPPKDKPRPPAAEGLAVAEWIGGEIRRVQQESRMAGGQILLRRLNRDEYANTVVDLLSLDVGMTDTIRSLLPADGTADGFDRIAAALYLDQTQMESYLDVAKFIADRAIFEKPLATNKLVWEPQKSIGFGGDKHVQADISKDIVLKAGARSGEKREDGIVAWNSGEGRPEPDNDPEKFYESGYGPQPDLSKTVTTDGYYRIRFPAGASRGDRGTPIRLKLTYAQGSSIATEHTIKEVQGTIDQPVMHEVLMFLRAPGPDQRVGLNWRWNAPKILMTNPAHTAAWMGFMGAQNKLAKGRTDGEGEATMAKLNQEREAAFQALATFDQFVFQIIPGKSIETAPKIFLGTFEIEGPIQEWPPKSHLALGYKESDAPNEQAIRLNLDHVMLPVEGAVILLKGMAGLEHAGLGVFADDKIVAAAADAPKLKTLSFGHWATVPESPLTKAGAQAFARLRSLESLHAGEQAPPAGGSMRDLTEAVAKIETLKSLTLAFISVKSHGKPKNPVTAADLEPLAALANLERLGIQHASLDRATASRLAEISSVKIVSFSAVKLDDGALVALKALPNLAVVEIWNSCDWSDADLEALKAAKPKVRFHMVGGQKK